MRTDCMSVNSLWRSPSSSGDGQQWLKEKNALIQLFDSNQAHLCLLITSASACLDAWACYYGICMCRYTTME